jgi:hypothetical protein
VPGAAQSQKFCDKLKVLGIYILIAPRHHWQRARSEREQLFAPARIIDDVDCYEIDLLVRKKLFRSQATASTGLCI